MDKETGEYMNRHTKLNVKLEHIPLLPGIYKMMDSERNIIYVGKSKCLKKRIKTYFTGNHKGSKIERLVLLINDIEFLISGGDILYNKILENPTKADIDLFINTGYTKKQSGAYDLTEKAALDYRDIIYSEIKSLPKEYYEIIKSK